MKGAIPPGFRSAHFRWELTMKSWFQEHVSFFLQPFAALLRIYRTNHHWKQHRPMVFLTSNPFVVAWWMGINLGTSDVDPPLNLAAHVDAHQPESYGKWLGGPRENPVDMQLRFLIFALIDPFKVNDSYPSEISRKQPAFKERWRLCNKKSLGGCLIKDIYGHVFFW